MKSARSVVPAGIAEASGAGAAPKLRLDDAAGLFDDRFAERDFPLGADERQPVFRDVVQRGRDLPLGDGAAAAAAAAWRWAAARAGAGPCRRRTKTSQTPSKPGDGECAATTAIGRRISGPPRRGAAAGCAAPRASRKRVDGVDERLDEQRSGTRRT